MATDASYDPPATVSSSTSYAVQVNPTGTPDCGVATWASGCRQITVLPLVTYGTVASGDQTFCGSGDPANITFSPAPSGGTGTFSYLWYYQDGIVACPSGTDVSGWTSTGVTTQNYDPPAGLTNTRTYAVFVDPGGTPDCGDAMWAANCRQITIEPLADLSLIKTASNPTPDVNTNITYTITVSNAGPADATGVVVNDLLLPGLAYVSDDGGGSYNPGTGVWNIGSIPNGGNVILNITVTVTTACPYNNFAEVMASDQCDLDSDPDNNVPAEDDYDAEPIIPVVVSQTDFNLGDIMFTGFNSDEHSEFSFVIITDVLVVVV
jgi:uncharacterized repeat protein (TIGR01451 family)